MPRRVIAFFLAFVLLCAGAGTLGVSQAFAAPAPDQPQALVPTQGDMATAGPATLQHQPDRPVDHPVDHPPVPLHGDASLETPGLLRAPMSSRLSGGPPERPDAVGSAGVAAPFLAGPLRPPCRTALAG